MKPTPALRSFLLGSTILAASPLLHATILYWDGTDSTANADGGTGIWNTASNWDTAATGGANAAWNNATPDSAVFGGAAATVTLGAVRTADSIQIDTGRYLITGSTLTINNGITLSSGSGNVAPGAGGAATGLTDISSAVTLGASQTWTNNSSDTVLRQLTGNVTLGAFTLTLKTTGNKAVNVAGTTSGTGSIIVDTNSIAAMSGTNTYSGTTTIKSGAILTVNAMANYNANSGLGNKSTNTASDLVIDGGTFRVQVSSATSDRQFTMGAGGATLEATNTGANSGQIRLTNTSGAIAYTGTGNRTLTIGGASDDAGGSTISLAIADVGGGNGTVALAKSGTHNWTVDGTNTYSGGTTVSAGILTTGSASALGSTSGQLTVNTGGTLNMAGQNLTVGNLTGTGGIISGTSGARLLTIGQGNTGGGDYQGQINNGAGGTTALTKTGNGTITLSGANNYTGDTTVSAGVLAVNGSLANTTTTVTGGTLQGSGSIGGSVTIQSGGTLAAGNSIESLATGALTLNVGSTFAYEMNKDVAATVAGDLTAVTGNLDILTVDLANAAILTLAELGTTGSWTVGEKLTLISYTGAWNNGLFKYLGGLVADDSTITFSGASWLFNYNDTAEGPNFASDSPDGESYVTMTVVPEPRAALLGGLGLLMLLRRRRRN